MRHKIKHSATWTDFNTQDYYLNTNLEIRFLDSNKIITFGNIKAIDVRPACRVLSYGRGNRIKITDCPPYIRLLPNALMSKVSTLKPIIFTQGGLCLR